jgi:hypothetical protein
MNKRDCYSLRHPHPLLSCAHQTHKFTFFAFPTTFHRETKVLAYPPLRLCARLLFAFFRQSGLTHLQVAETGERRRLFAVDDHASHQASLSQLYKRLQRLILSARHPRPRSPTPPNTRARGLFARVCSPRVCGKEKTLICCGKPGFILSGVSPDILFLSRLALTPYKNLADTSHTETRREKLWTFDVGFRQRGVNTTSNNYFPIHTITTRGEQVWIDNWWNT